jgi:hypothetical protein
MTQFDADGYIVGYTGPWQFGYKTTNGTETIIASDLTEDEALAKQARNADTAKITFFIRPQV